MDKQPIDLTQFGAQITGAGAFPDHACAFTGHRPQKFPWGFHEKDPACVTLKETLAGQIAALVDAGYTDFLSGMALGVDVWAAQAVLALRKKKRGLFGLGKKSAPRLHCFLPCEGQDAKWPHASKELYRSVLEQADSVVYVSRKYDDQCMLRRNRALVENAALVLAVYDGEARGGTAATVRYARELGRELIVIDPVTRVVSREGKLEAQR